MNNQNIIEKGIFLLVEEFKEDAYAFFTEADAVIRFHQILREDPSLNRKFRTKDEKHEVGLVHSEYPTFFRFTDSNPIKRLGPPARRGHYDTVILSPDFVIAHPAETVSNKNIYSKRDQSIMPFQAVMEFKLHDYAPSKKTAKGIKNELGKLKLSEKEAPLRYLIVLTRYRAPTMRRWEPNWPSIREVALEFPLVNSIFVVNWVNIEKDSTIHLFGPWINEDLLGLSTI